MKFNPSLLAGTSSWNALFCSLGNACWESLRGEALRSPRAPHPLFSGVNPLRTTSMPKSPSCFFLTFRNNWLEDDGTMSLDDSHRSRSHNTLHWLQTHGLSSVPRNIKEEIGSLIYNLDRSKGSDDLATPPGLVDCRCPVGKVGKLRRCPVS